MSNIDKQRVAAVRMLEAMGYMFAAIDWQPAADHSRVCCAIRRRAARLLVTGPTRLAAALKARWRNGALRAITDAIDGYELVRWPDGKVPDGKG